MLTHLLLILMVTSTEAPPDIPVHEGALTLEQALRYAEKNNERVGRADAAVERARGQYWVALSALLPNLNVSGTYVRRRDEASAIGEDGERVFFQRRNARQALAQLTMSVIRPDQYPRVAAASDDIEAARKDALNERLTLRFDAAGQFFLAMATRGIADAAEERIRVAQASLDEARARFSAGLEAANTVTRAELELATAKVTATESMNNAEIARLTLSFIIGVDVRGDLVDPPQAGPVVSDPSALYDVARKERPDLQALRHRKDAAASRQLAPVLDWLPELNVQTFYSLTNEPGFGPNDNYNFSATLAWQLFDGGARIGQEISADADFRDVALQIRALERQVRLDIENQLRQVRSAVALVAEAEARFEVARRNNEEVGQRLKAGLATGLEAADAAAELFNAEAELNRQRFEQRRAELALRQVIAADPLEPVSAQ
ncbi:MAG: TolC family protein [Myxococcota bacterium]